MTEQITNPIYIKLSRKPKTVRHLLKKFFSYKSYGRVLNVQSYSNDKYSRCQCVEGKFRSFDDVLRLVNTYFPNTSKEQVIETLLTLDIKDREKQKCNLHMDYCCTMQKVRMWFTSYTANGFNTASRMPKGRSEFGWKELLASVGVNSEETLANLIQNKS